MKATLKDIAARVGVTSQLVSFYLNHPETTRVARETREKIDAAVKELNYRPNSPAPSAPGRPEPSASSWADLTNGNGAVTSIRS